MTWTMCWVGVKPEQHQTKLNCLQTRFENTWPRFSNLENPIQNHIGGFINLRKLTEFTQVQNEKLAT
jgi:hypothetical protein